MSATSDQLLTTTEAGVQLGVTRGAVASMCEAGTLVGAFPTKGGHWRIPRAAVEHYKASTRPVRRLRPTG